MSSESMAVVHNDENRVPHPNQDDLPETTTTTKQQQQGEEHVEEHTKEQQVEEQTKRQKPSEDSSGVSTGHVVSALSQTVAGLQNAMGMVCQKMAASLQKNLCMMNQMNDCMEHYVQAGLDLSVQVLPCKQIQISEAERGPSVRITIRNTARISIPNITFSLSFTSDEQTTEPQILLQENCHQFASSRKRIREDDDKAQAGDTSSASEDQPQWQSAAADTSSSAGAGTGALSDRYSAHLQCAALTLSPGQCFHSEFSSRLRSVTLHRGRLLASLPSPGTGAMLTVERHFEVRVLEQLERSWTGGVGRVGGGERGMRASVLREDDAACGRKDGQGPAEIAARRRIGIARLRAAFAIPGREGVEEGSCGTLRVPGGDVVCVVTVCEGGNAEEEEEPGSETVAVRVQVCTELGKMALQELRVEV